MLLTAIVTKQLKEIEDRFWHWRVAEEVASFDWCIQYKVLTWLGGEYAIE